MHGLYPFAAGTFPLGRRLSDRRLQHWLRDGRGFQERIRIIELQRVGNGGRMFPDGSFRNCSSQALPTRRKDFPCHEPPYRHNGCKKQADRPAGFIASSFPTLRQVRQPAEVRTILSAPVRHSKFRRTAP